MLSGPRAVGKTVTISAFGELAKDQRFEVVNLQAVSGLESLMNGLLQQARTRLGDEAGPWQRPQKAFEHVGGVSLSVAGFNGGSRPAKGSSRLLERMPEHWPRPWPPSRTRSRGMPRAGGCW